MNLKNIIAVSGMAGLYKIVSTKNNGIVVADIDNGKTTFCSVRMHQFTPMETVAIYTYEDTTPIGDIFKSMLQKSQSLIVPSPNASHTELKKYFEIILPEYDRDRVFHSDMKKIIKWFNFLNERGLLSSDETSTNEEE